MRVASASPPPGRVNGARDHGIWNEGVAGGTTRGVRWFIRRRGLTARSA